MAGRTLGEAWVTIRPETAAFRAELMTKVKSAMKGYNPSVKISVDINPDTAKLRTELKTAVTTASKGLTTTASVKTNLDNASVAKTKAAIAAATKDSKVNIDGTVDPALIARVDAFRDKLISMIISTDDKQAETQLSLLDAKANQLAIRLKSIKTDVGIAGALVQMAALDAAAAKFQHTMAAKGGGTASYLNFALANSQLTHLEQNAASLKKEIDSALSPSGITIGKVTDDAKKDLIGLRGGAVAVADEIARIRATGIVTQDDITKVKTLTSGLSQLSSAVAADGVTVSSASGSYRGWVNTLLSIARTQIPLFNGALEKMLPHFLAVASGTHMLVEAAIEIIAVWVPAAAALTVFAGAATVSAYYVAKGVKNMMTAAQGTGQAFNGMATSINNSMFSIAKPYVFEAYGLGLIALQHQSKTTAGVIQTVGGQIDKWMAEAVIAYQKSTGKLAQGGATDLGMLGDAFKQVGTIIHGFTKIAPGYAKDLLSIGDAVLHAVSAILNSGFVQALGKVFLALHGAIFYLGLFATLSSKLGVALLSPLAKITGLSRALGLLGVSASGTKGKMGELITSMVEGWKSGTGKITSAVDEMGFPLQAAMGNSVDKATKEVGDKFSGLKSVVSDAMGGMGGKVATATKGIKGALGGMLSSLGVNPWLLGLAAIGVGIFALVQMFKGGASAAQQFGAAATQALSSSSIATFGTNVTVQMKAAKLGMAGAQDELHQLVTKLSGAKYGTDAYTASLNRLSQERGASIAIRDATGAVGQWQSAINGIQAQNSQFNSNMNLIAKTSGVDLPTALNLATQAGLTTKQMMSDTGVAAQEDALMVKGLVAGYNSLVNGIGGVNTAYQAMNIQNSNTMTDAKNVASAFANYTSLITGGANAFDNFVQGQTTLASSMKNLPGSTTTATLSLGKLRDRISLVGASLDGLSPAAVTANQAFLQQVNNAQALYGQLIQLAAASGNTATAQHNVSAAGKDMISTLLKTAGGSKSAQQQVYSLAETMGYTGKNTLPAMYKWLGMTGDKTTDLQKRMNGLTAGAGNMDAASKALSNEMNGQLGQAMSKSIIDAEGGQGAFDKFATAVRKLAAAPNASNMQNVMKQGENLKQVFLSSAGSAAAAEPILQNYFTTLGIKNQNQAKQMADQILGIGKAANSISKPVQYNQKNFTAWASQIGIATGKAGDMWVMLSKNNFNPLSGNVDDNKKKFMDWAKQMGINKTKASDLWSQLLNNKLQTVNAQVDGNKKKFVDLMVKMGETEGAALSLWGALKKAPNVKASVAVAASTSGQVQAVAQASGAQKQVIGKLFFSAQGHGLATGGPVPGMMGGGKLPGWHNTGDNLLAVGPSGPIGLQGGEAIVPKNLATHPEFTSFARKKGIPGFASGGLVGTDALGNIGDSYGKWRTDTANSSISFAGDSLKANIDGAYDALANVYKGIGGSVKGQQILLDAEKYKGHKYVWGGPSNPAQGWDCSSFAGYVLGHDFHLPLPGGTKWDSSAHGPVASQYNNEPGFSLVSHNPQQIQAGDLLVEGSGGHVGFGVGPNQMFSAYGSAVGTIFSDAKNMTNIYRSGSGGAAGATVAAIKTGVPLIDKMAASAASDYATSSALNALFPALGGTYTGNPTGGATGGATGTDMFNGKELYNYLLTNLFGGNKIAAAGATASIWGESAWDPSAQGTGGRGLIGWTPAGTISNADFNGGMATQLPAILKFVTQNSDMGVVAQMFQASSVAQAAQEWDQGVERAGINDVHSTGISLASSFMAKGGKVPGFATGGKVSAPVSALAKLQHEHDLYAADYHRHMAQAAKDKSKSAKDYQLTQAAAYAKKISTVDTEIAYDKAAKLTMMKPTNDDMRLAEKLTTSPWVNKLTSGPGSVTPLGWGLQPILGDLMIAGKMGTSQWLGKANIDPQASSVMANWVAAMESVGGFLGSNPNVAKLAGAATGVHGKTTGGKSFLGGGTLRENVYGIGHSGAQYTMHSGDKILGPSVAANQDNSAASNSTNYLLLLISKKLDTLNNTTANTGHQVAKSVSGNNITRKIGR